MRAQQRTAYHACHTPVSVGISSYFHYRGAPSPPTSPTRALIRDESLTTCGEGVEGIHIYLMGFLSPLSDLCNYFGPHSRTSEETPNSFFLKCSLFFISHPSECAELWSPYLMSSTPSPGRINDWSLTHSHF